MTTRTRITILAALLTSIASPALAGWSDDAVWHDGLVERATYTASRVIYGRPRSFEAVFFTNKEQHDRRTMTKADRSTDTVEVWKHNQVEVVPTPNYDYKFEATSHLTVAERLLTRLDVASQEFCGASFKQYQLEPGNGSPRWTYFGFSYMPEAGRVTATVTGSADAPTVPFNGLPLYLRGYDFEKRPTLRLRLLPDQKSNRQTPHEPVAAEVRHVGETADAHELEVTVEGKPYGRFAFAKDRLHVMLRYAGADGQRYELKAQERVNYWTIKGE